MEGLKVSKANLTVYIHPSKSKQVSQAVLRELSSLLFKYARFQTPNLYLAFVAILNLSPCRFSEAFDGVVLAYDVNSVDTCAKILPAVHPYFGVKLKVNLLLFSPKPNTLLEGKVVKLTQESIHVVVLGFASAIIAEKDIREEFVCKTKQEQDVYASRSHKRHVIKVGTVIRFDEEILHIYGSLIPEHTGSIYWLNKNMEVVSHNDRSEKKRRIEPIKLEQDAVDGELSTLDIVQQRKNSKKQKHLEES
ncbi:hypothetical protein CR513_00978 [Mucuna pruriens]|uniref:DNA-directed RNA polymerase subunit n=1 Tax=Mucuna pruriens TaxID=157652 RepID=A0A371IGA6_MUCPR|nr:hypothetical protein CR513_00978 [Mucuna pruriens]